MILAYIQPVIATRAASRGCTGAVFGADDVGPAGSNLRRVLIFPALALRSAVLAHRPFTTSRTFLTKPQCRRVPRAIWVPGSGDLSRTRGQWACGRVCSISFAPCVAGRGFAPEADRSGGRMLV